MPAEYLGYYSGTMATAEKTKMHKIFFPQLYTEEV